MVGESPLLQHRQAPDIGDDPADEGIRQHIARQAPPKVRAARGLIVDIFRDLIQKTPRWGVGRSSVPRLIRSIRCFFLIDLVIRNGGVIDLHQN
jgi:hypothetical protein